MTREPSLAMSKRPEFTIAQITTQFTVSRSTVRRCLNDGRFPNAKKDHHGRWLIPVDDVIQAGFTPRKTWLNEPGSQDAPGPSQLVQNNVETNNNAGSMDLVHLEKELAHERAQVEKLKALLEAERNHVESLRMALRMIETKKPNPPEAAVTTPEPAPDQATSGPATAAKRSSLFQQLFKPRARRREINY